MLSRHAAQTLLDGLSALTLTVAALGVARQVSPLRSRLIFALGGLAVFFAARAAFEAGLWQRLDVVQRAIPCLLPLAALLLSEGVLRRHAPALLKLWIVAGGLTALGLAFLAGGQEIASEGLGAYVVASLAACTVMLLARNRASLSRQENANVSALVAAGLLVTAASVSDFLPNAAIGLSGVGAASVAFALAAAPASRRDAQRVVLEFLALAAMAIAVATALSYILEFPPLAETIRLAGILLSALLAAGVVVSAVRARSGTGEAEFSTALVQADTTSLDRFLDGLADQPLLRGMRLAGDAETADYDAAGLAAALLTRPVWSQAALSTLADRPREELADLMSRHDATHAVLASSQPLRIALLTLPDGGVLDIQLALFGKLAFLAAKSRP